jgi:hypothetical protein
VGRRVCPTSGLRIGCFCCPGAEACACTVICRRIPTGTDRILLSLKFPSIWPVRTISPSWRANSGNYRSHVPVRSPRRPRVGLIPRSTRESFAQHLAAFEYLEPGAAIRTTLAQVLHDCWIPATRLPGGFSTGRHPQPMVFMSLPRLGAPLPGSAKLAASIRPLRLAPCSRVWPLGSAMSRVRSRSKTRRAISSGNIPAR